MRFMTGNAARWVAGVQSAYFISTGLWPVLHLSSFLSVTGPKHDLWLMQAFGLLVCAQGAALLFAFIGRRALQALPFGVSSAAMLAVIDVWFVASGDIGRVYLLDAGAEALLVASWLIVQRRRMAEQH